MSGDVHVNSGTSASNVRRSLSSEWLSTYLYVFSPQLQQVLEPQDSTIRDQARTNCFGLVLSRQLPTGHTLQAFLSYARVPLILQNKA